MRLAGVLSDISTQGLGATPRPTGVMLPVSNRVAVAAAVRRFQGRSNTLAGYLGDSAQTSAAVSGASAGAKAGSIIPGVGTVIGAFVGAVVGWLSAKKKPVRATAEQVAQCQTETAAYMAYAAEYPTTPLPLELTQIKDMTWCGAAIHGAMVKLKDPRFFLGGFDERTEICRQIVRKVYATKVGDTVEITGLSFTDAKGKKISLPGTSFVNKPFTSILELTERVLIPLEIANCAPWGKGACSDYVNLPLIKRTLFDLMGYAARTALPNISEADLAAASHVASQVGASARDVVSAVETIMQRSVQRNETALVLTQTNAASQEVIKEIANDIAQRAPPVASQSPDELVKTTPLATPPPIVTPEVQRDVTGAAASTATPGIEAMIKKAGPWLALAALSYFTGA